MALFDQAGLAPVKAFMDGAPDLISKLQASGMTVEADLVAGMHGAATDLVSQAVSGLLKVEGPVMDQWKATNDSIATLIGIFQAIKDSDSVASLMLFGGKKISQPS